MSYIGRDISNLSDRAVLDSITTSATATYNLLLNSVAYVPSSAESLTVSLNGVIQAPQSSYTVSGSTIVFASNLASSDVIDFILAERAITLTTIGSGTVTTSNIVDANVTTAKIADNAVTSAKLASGLALGKIGQVVQTVSSTKVATTSQSFIDILTVAITPSATSSKILINFSGMVGTGGANLNNTYQITRDSTALQVPQFARSDETDANRSSVTNLLDSPSSTSAITYKMQFKCASNEMFLNRNGSNDQCGFSTLTVMEVLA